MVKMKVKKEMTLPELIKWSWKSRVTYTTYTSSEDGEVYFDGYGGFATNTDIEPEETFEVEVEQEITEDTVIPKLAHYYVQNGMSLIVTRSQKSISEVLKINTKGEGFINLAFYIVNEDLSMTLIWKDGEMVE